MGEESVRTENPLVSVVVPVFNGEKTIARAIASVFEQTYPNIECIVVDDASTDSTGEILRSFGDRIRAIFNDKNRGTAGAYNVGTAAARGSFVLLMASDCYLIDPVYVERALEHFHDPGVAAVCGQGIFDDAERLNTIQRIFTTVNLLDVVDSEDDVFEVAFIETRCDLVRKSALEEIGFWFEGLYNSTEDQDISARMRERGYRLLQDKRLKFALDFGQTEDNLCKVVKKQFKYASGQSYIFLKYGLGHHTMTGDQANRRARIVHRATQIALGPTVLGLACLAPFSALAAYGLAGVLGTRGLWYWWMSRRWLAMSERFFCAGVGLVCDLTYSTSFLGSMVLWIVRDPSLLRFGGALANDRPSA